MTTFAALQSRVNAAAAAKLLTDAATLNGVALTGKFDNGSAAGMNNMLLGSNPTFTCLASAAGSSSRGQTLVVDTVSYTVREAKPDGTGFTLLELEKA